MSRQRGCEFIEPEPGKWYMLLDDSDIANAWDWRENADCYGPFSSLDTAFEELYKHSNPGGYSTTCYIDFHMDEVYQAVIAKAFLPKPLFQRLRGYPYPR